MSPVGAVAHGLGTVLHQLLVQGRRYTCVVAAISMSEIQMIYTRRSVVAKTVVHSRKLSDRHCCKIARARWPAGKNTPETKTELHQQN